MHAILIYLFKVIICSGLLFGYYLLALKNKKLHTYNRFYLLTSIVLSFTAPLLHFEWYKVKTPASITAVKMLQVVSGNSGEREITGHAASQLDIWGVAAGVYVLVTGALLLLLMGRIVWIYKLKKKGTATQYDDILIIQTDTDKAPFSFFNTLFWKESIDIGSETGQHILRHELTHIRQRHTLDKLFMQSVLIVFWINPIYWLMQKELSMIHEFIADSEAVQQGDTAAFAKMLLQSHYGNMLPDIAQSFFYSPIKRRLIMLSKTNKTSYAYMRKLLMLPVAGLVLGLFSFTINDQNPMKSKEKILLVLDAAHGGMDKGAVNGNVKEKDLTLMIVNRMEELAPEYNIDIVRTRTGDDYPTLQQRVDKANSVKADLFLSIHVNSSDYDRKGSNYELIVSKPNAKYADCKMLASAISSRMNEINIKPALIEKNLLVLKENEHPAIAIECGKIDDAHDLAMMSDKKQLDKLCRSILDGVVIFRTNKNH